MILASTTLVAALLGSAAPAAAPALAPVHAPEAIVVPFHCQVPCGIYGDHLRVELLREHVTTIEKAMQQIQELGAADVPNWNQLVRWITTKDEHAQKIQDQINEYWLAQRVKEPAPDDAEKMGVYVRQLVLQHRMTTAAMRCKQTTDAKNVAALRAALDEFVGVYFSPEDQEHLKSHGAGEKKEAAGEHSHGGGR